MKNLILIFMAFGLFACGKSGGDSGQKSAFSMWTRTSPNPGGVIDLSNFRSGEPREVFLANTDGAVCSCIAAAVGTNSAGAFIVTSCTYEAGTGPGDPGCSSKDGTGNYSVSGGELTISWGNGDVSKWK